MYDEDKFKKPTDWRKKTIAAREAASGSVADASFKQAPAMPDRAGSKIMPMGGLFGAADMKEDDAPTKGGGGLFDDEASQMEYKNEMKANPISNPLIESMQSNKPVSAATPMNEEYKPQPTISEAQRKKTLAFITGGDDNSDEDEDFIPSKLPKVDEKKDVKKPPMPKLEDSDDDYKPSTKRIVPGQSKAPPKAKAGLGLPPPPAAGKPPPVTAKPSVRKTVAFAGSDDDSDGFANITMKPQGGAKPLPKIGKGSKAAFQDSDDERESFLKPAAKPNPTKAPPKTGPLPSLPGKKKKPLADSDDEDMSFVKKPVPRAQKPLPPPPVMNKPLPVTKPGGQKEEKKDDFKNRLGSMLAGGPPKQMPKKDPPPVD